MGRWNAVHSIEWTRSRIAGTSERIPPGGRCSTEDKTGLGYKIHLERSGACRAQEKYPCFFICLWMAR